jgi:hypothetical protein
MKGYFKLFDALAVIALFAIPSASTITAKTKPMAGSGKYDERLNFDKDKGPE